MRVRCIAPILLLVMFSFHNALRAQASGDPDAQQLAQLEQVWNHAHESGDASALDRLWASDLEVDVPRMAAMTKDDVLGFARRNAGKQPHQLLMCFFWCERFAKAALALNTITLNTVRPIKTMPRRPAV